MKTRVARHARLALLASTLTVVTVASCRGHDAATRAALEQSLESVRARPTIEPPTLDEVFALRQSAPRALASVDAGEGLLGDARRALVALGDGARFAAVVAEAASDPRVAELACLHGYAAGRPELVVDACARALKDPPDTARATALVAALAHVRGETPGVDALVVDEGRAWVAACARGRQGSCAPLAALVDDMRLRAASRAHDLDRAAAIARESGLVTEARLSGPLVGDVALVLARAARGERAEPRAHRAFVVDRVAHDGVFAPALRAEAGVYRVEAAFRGAGEAELIVRADDAYELFVDGTRVASRSLGDAGAPTLTRVGVTLREGVHAIEALVVAHGPAERFSVRVLDEAGAPLALERTVSSRGAGAALRALEPILERPGTDSSFESLDDAVAMVTLRLAGAFVDEADALIVEKRLAGDLALTPTAVVLAARALAADRALDGALARRLATPLLALVDEHATQHPDVALARAETLADEHPEEALAVIERAIATHADALTLHRVRARLALDVNALHLARASGEFLASRALLPVDVELATSVALARGDLEGAAILEARRPELDDDLFSAAHARVLLSVGARADAVSELARIVDGDPGTSATELFWDLLEMSSPAEARASVEQHLARFPLDRSAWKRAVALARVAVGDEAARAVVETATAAIGASRALFDAAIELGAAPAYAAELARLDALIEEEARKPSPPSGHAIFVVDASSTRTLFVDGSSHLVRSFLARIDGEDGIDALGEIRAAPGEDLVRLRVHKPDGTVFEPDFHDGVADASLAGLALGDLVELVAISFVEWPLTDGASFETRVLEEPLPARARRYALVVPDVIFERPDFRLVARHGARAPVIERVGGARHVTFTKDDVAAVPFEEGAVADEESLATVGFSFGIDDARYASLWRERALVDHQRSAWLDEAARLIAGDGSPRARKERIERFVATRIEPESERDPRVILARARGDRLAIFGALARAADLDVHDVAIEVPALAPREHPHANAWATRGLRIVDDDGVHYLIGDERLGELDALAPVLEGARALDLRPLRPSRGFFSFIETEAPLVVDVEPALVDARPVVVRLSLEPSADGRALGGLVVYEVPRALAGALRRALARSSDDERRAAFEGILSANMTPLVVTDVVVPDVERTGLDLTIGVYVTVPMDGGRAVRRFERLFPEGAGVPLGLFPSLVRPLRHVDRVRPMRFLAASEELIVEVRLPPGATFTEVPERRQNVAGPVSLTTEVEVTDGLLRLNRVLEVSRRTVDPAQWPRQRAELAQLVAQADAQIGFVWGEPPTSSD